jgi:hypothetical protein
MKKFIPLFAAMALAATIASAGTPPQTGTVLSQSSATCGEKKAKKQSFNLLCQQYVVRSGSTDYTVQQPKPEDKKLIPLNTAVEFKLDKSKMKLKASGKSFEFMVISQAAVNAAPATPAPATAGQNQQ